MKYCASGNEHQGSVLTITKDMVGENEWMCIASNTIEGQHHQTTKEVYFRAGKF